MCVHTQRCIKPSYQLKTPSNDNEDVIWTEIWTADRSLDHKTKLNNKFYAYLSILVARLKPDPNLSNFDKNYTVEDKCIGIMFDTKIMWWLTHENPKHLSHQDAHINEFVLFFIFISPSRLLPIFIIALSLTSSPMWRDVKVYQLMNQLLVWIHSSATLDADCTLLDGLVNNRSFRYFCRHMIDHARLLAG